MDKQRKNPAVPDQRIAFVLKECWETYENDLPCNTDVGPFETTQDMRRPCVEYFYKNGIVGQQANFVHPIDIEQFESAYERLISFIVDKNYLVVRTCRRILPIKGRIPISVRKSEDVR